MDYRARTYGQPHRRWPDRGGYDGYLIPHQDFRRHFGRDRRFRIYRLPFLWMAGRPRFQYDGYWIELIDPYPYDWGDYWYETDDVCLDYYDGGYYLFNPRYPPHRGIAVRINIAL